MYIQIELRELWVKRKELMYEPFYPGASLVPSLPRFFLGEVTSRRIQKCLFSLLRSASAAREQGIWERDWLPNGYPLTKGEQVAVFVCLVW